MFIKRLFTIITLLTFLACEFPFNDQEDPVVRDLYKEIINNPENKYIVKDSNVITSDQIHYYYNKIGDKQYYYQHTSDWVGGLEPIYSGQYITNEIKTKEDSIQIGNMYYSFDRYSRPIMMDNGSYTYEGEDTAGNYSRIIINDRFGILFKQKTENISTMSGHSEYSVYLSLNDTSIPTAKMINEFNDKKKLLKSDSIWIQ
jgi:hypothetical protein